MVWILCPFSFEGVELCQLSSYEVLGKDNALSRSLWRTNSLAAEWASGTLLPQITEDAGDSVLINVLLEKAIQLITHLYLFLFEAFSFCSQAVCLYPPSLALRYL